MWVTPDPRRMLPSVSHFTARLLAFLLRNRTGVSKPPSASLPSTK